MALSNFRSNSISCRLFKIESTTEYGETIHHLIGRDKYGTRHHVEVEGHYPSLFIEESDYSERVENHVCVNYTQTGYQNMYGQPLRRLYGYKHDDVKELDNTFDQTYEGDVWATNRFLIDKQIYTGFSFDPDDAREGADGDYRIHSDNVTACDAPDIQPRVLTFDIEVMRTDGGFPHAHIAQWPVTTIVAHDSYSDEYVGWFLYDNLTHQAKADYTKEELQSDIDELENMDDARIFDSEKELLNDFNWWVGDVSPDLLTGWNADGFDFQYMINRSENIGLFSHRDWSPLEEVYTTRYGRANVSGLSLFDMLDAYEKTQIHQLSSYKLDAVAEKELGRGKVEMDGDFIEMYEQHPVEFMRYNIRDVEAVIKIDEAQEIVQTFEHMRDVTGAGFEQMIGNNINMIDLLTLRMATDSGIQLPTATKPDEDWYFGAKVFDPKAGLHEHVVYPDLSSLYPNMMYQCNMSPETIVGTKSDLFMSEYSEDDCIYSYVDPRPVARVQKGTDYAEYKDGTYKAIMRTDGNGWETVWSDDPQPVKMYYLKPSVKQGFVASMVGQLLDMKMEYKGTDKYEAVKRVVNSVYGVFGDSNTGHTGFRLFDWRMAESITLGGRKVIEHSASRFISHANEYKAALGLEGDDVELVGGDTDSVMTAIRFANSADMAVEVAEEAAACVNKSYDDFCRETFGIDEHRMEIEVESYSPRCFFVQDDDAPDGVGTKKRYVTKITVEDGVELDEPKFNIKGFEAVRSDTSQITTDAQTYAFEQLMDEDIETAHENITSRVAEIYNNAEQIPLEDIGVPFGIGKELSEYGSVDRRPMPWHRGAKYANQHIYGDAIIQRGMKPLYFYVTDTGSYPSTYSAQTAEDGTEVDCIAVDEPQDVPDDFTVDRSKMLEKGIEKPLKPIYDTLGWEWEDARIGGVSAARFM